MLGERFEVVNRRHGRQLHPRVAAITVGMEASGEFRADDPDLAEKMKAEAEGIFLWALEGLQRLVANIERVIYGKRDVVEMCVAGLLARGHVLIEDIPGIGKTTLAQGLARSVDCTFNRIQFTSDMLPSDILGVSVLDPKTTQFEFRPGPIFAGIVLADEVNRTPPIRRMFGE